jgi:succinyl-diaminopimelate desuccinylase
MHSLEEIQTLTKNLISCRSVADKPDQIIHCLDLIEEALSDLASKDWIFSRLDFEGHPSLAITKANKSPKVLLCGHIDVVEGKDDQFKPKIDGDKLYGRGALDMKSGVAVLVIAFREAANKNYDVGLMVTSDEEMGGFHGTQALLQAGYSCQVALLPDGGNAVNKIVHKAKGVLWIELEAQGKSAHASVPWQGENAIQKLMAAIDTMQSIFPAVEIHGADHWAATCNIGLIQGGSGTNQVPASAIAHCDIRYTEHDTPDNLVTLIQNSLPDGVVVRQTLTAPMTYTPLENEFVQSFMQALREQGCEPEIAVDHGSSDARFFSERKIPVIVCQPDGQGHHGDNEWVSLNGIKDYYETVKKFLDKVCE